MRTALVDYFAPEYAVHARLQETGEWSGARGTALAVPTRPKKGEARSEVVAERLDVLRVDLADAVTGGGEK